MFDIKKNFCPSPSCKHNGLRNQRNIVISGSYMSNRERKQLLRCIVCKVRYLDTQNTNFHHSCYPVDTIRKIISCVAKRNGVRGTARILELIKDGVKRTFIRTGENCLQVLFNLLTSLYLEEYPEDVLWAFTRIKVSYVLE